jgi:hypothetical protein
MLSSSVHAEPMRPTAEDGRAILTFRSVAGVDRIAGSALLGAPAIRPLLDPRIGAYAAPAAGEQAVHWGNPN